MVINTTFNNISVISWRSVLLVEETGENHRPVASHLQTLSHNVISSTHRHVWNSISQFVWWQALIAQVVVIPTDIRSRPRLSQTNYRLIKDIYKYSEYIYNLYLQNYAHVGQSNTINKGTNTIQANY